MVRGNKFKQQASDALPAHAPKSKSAAYSLVERASQQPDTRALNGGFTAAAASKKKRKLAKAAAAVAAAPAVTAGAVQAAAAQPEHGSKRGKRSRRGKDRGAGQQLAQHSANAGGPAAAVIRNDAVNATQPVHMPSDRPASDAVRDEAGGAARPPPVLHIPSIRVTGAGAGGGASVGGNWAALKAQLASQPHPHRRQHKRQKLAAAAAEAAGVPEDARSLPPQAISDDASPTPVVAVDCEMVGVGPDGMRSQLARVCIVNNHGAVLMDKFAKPKERVTDFRTRYSGIRPADIKHAPAFEEVQREAASLLQSRIVVGHSITNDLKALLLGHPAKAIRDTARFPPLMLPRRPGGKARPRALRALAAEQLGLTIQGGEHSPVDDARAALYLYHKHRKVWEAELQQHGSVKRLRSLMAGAGRKSAARSLADLAKADDMVDL